MNMILPPSDVVALGLRRAGCVSCGWRTGVMSLELAEDLEKEHTAMGCREFPAFQADFIPATARCCAACGTLECALDKATRLCVACWRVVVLAAAAPGNSPKGEDP